ncbi:transmembrane protein, putative [Bodo saltans]|uniref:Transmembrane protein, putative n=1 Tax=Bodo saltans TaxID=75058 RepID=A0A0S4IZM2_BODSA|nr:transmembrane protein, putative [Bodo saltans]|eukprot:CUG28832.1 transmembrane protein, putative [Bodo saltans]
MSVEVANSTNQDDAPSRQVSLAVPSYSEPFGTLGVSPVSDATRPSELIVSWGQSFDHAIEATDAAIRTYEVEFSKTPWTGGKDGWGGVRKVVIHEVGMFMYDCLAVFCFLLILCTLYRIVPFFRSIPKLNNLRRACLLQVAEIGIDIFYVYKVLLVLSFVKGAFSLPSDLVFYLLQKPSFDVARQIIDYHLGSVLEDLIYILSLVFAWDTIRFALATAVFGVFSPCVVLEGAFSRWDGTSGENRPDWNPCVAFCLLMLSSLWVIGVPVFVGYYVAQHNVASAPGAVFFAIMGFVLYLGLAVTAAQRDEAVVSIRRHTVRCLSLSLRYAGLFLAQLLDACLSLSLRYAGLFLAQLLDAAQLLALVFQASRPDLYGATIGGGLEQASNYVFATFGATWTSNGVPFGTYLAIILAIFYFIVAGAPVVCGDMLHWRKGSLIVQSPAWVAAMTFLGQTCMLTVVRNISLLFSCDESTFRLSFSTPDAPAICWQGGLKSTTVFCAILLTYYVPTALMKNQKFNVAIMRSVDVVSPQLYHCLTRLPIATCCVLCTLRYEHRAFTLATVLVTMIWCVLVSLVYPRLVQSPISSVQTVGWYKVIVYAVVGVSAALVLGQLQQDVASGPSYWSLYATIAVVATAIVAIIVLGVLLSRATRAQEDSIDDVKKTMARARQQLAALGALKAMPGEGDAGGKVFARRLAQATRCSELAVLLLYLEGQCYTMELSAVFLSTRQAWEKKTLAIMDPNDKSNALDIDWYRMDFPRYLLCCECCRDVNSHNRRRDDDDDDPSVTEDDKLVVLQEVCQSLMQAARCR